jgi:hypothetical protein
MKPYLLASAIIPCMAGCLVPTDDPADRDAAEISTDVTDPAALIASYEQALDQSDFEAYVALLEAPAGPLSGFQFFPLPDDDVSDFPWLEWDHWHWPYPVEVAAIRRLMDPNPEGRDTAVTAIQADLDVLSKRVLEGDWIVTTSASIRVFVGSEVHCSTETRLEFQLAEDADGFLRIRSMREIDAGQSETWAQIKGGCPITS